MKKLIMFLSVLSICSTLFAVNKNVVYNKDTKEVIAVKTGERPATETGRVDIVCEGVVKYGVNPDKVSTVAIDEKNIPADITVKAYKIDTDTKEIYQEVKLGD